MTGFPDKELFRLNFRLACREADKVCPVER
jgi:hypothetical protein